MNLHCVVCWNSDTSLAASFERLKIGPCFRPRRLTNSDVMLHADDYGIVAIYVCRHGYRFVEGGTTRSFVCSAGKLMIDDIDGCQRTFISIRLFKLDMNIGACRLWSPIGLLAAGCRSDCMDCIVFPGTLLCTSCVATHAHVGFSRYPAVSCADQQDAAWPMMMMMIWWYQISYRKH